MGSRDRRGAYRLAVPSEYDKKPGVRVLAASDLHYALPQFDWLVSKAAGYDLVVLAGDLLDLSAAVDPDVQILVVSRYLQEISERTTLAVCSGNHDGDVQVETGEFAAEWLRSVPANGLHIDGDTFLLGPDRVSICPWWESPQTRDRMVEKLRADAADEPHGRRWIWLHHAPPNDCAVSWTGKAHGGDAFLNELIGELRPDVVFSGHIHNAPFYSHGGWVAKVGETWVFNGGRQLGRIPSTITLDLDTLEARFRSLEESDTRFLASDA